MYAFGCQVAQTLLVYLYLMVAVGTAIFDCLNYRQRLYYAPAHAVALDIFAQVADFLTSPNLAQRYVVKCSNDAFYTDLSQLCKSNLILLAKPSPSSFHVTIVLICYFYAAKLRNYCQSWLHFWLISFSICTFLAYRR